MKSMIMTLILTLQCICMAQPNSEKLHSQFNLNCKECHGCDIPTHKNPCLILFPEFRRQGMTVLQSAEETPELIVIDKMKDEYEPTIFTHRLHAEMASMSGGCESCHHFNPPGKILSCESCHEKERSRELRKPSLKGAYHRQCLDCHLEWSHTTNCTVCHEKRGSKFEDKKEFLGKSHEKLVVPKKIVYQTPEADDPIVTFFHDDHSGKFGLKCSVCHSNESCNRCHDQDRGVAKIEKEEHENCSLCHEAEIDDDCEKCHMAEESSPFSHETKGWKLNRFHQDLKCESCHKDNNFQKIAKKCLSCHKEWNKGQFDHKITGLILDEDHVDHDCKDCHIQSNFDSKPSCEACHDDEFSFPASLPGTRIKG